MRPHTRQARQQVFILRKLDLQLTLAGLCALGENVENETGAVKHLDAELLGQHTHLRGRQLIVENREVAVVHFDEVLELRDLAVAYEAARVGGRAVLHEHTDALAAGGLDKGGKLLHGDIRGALARVHGRRRKSREDGAFNFYIVCFYCYQSLIKFRTQYIKSAPKCHEKRKTNARQARLWYSFIRPTRGGEGMAYSELIKSFEKIRGYMREFYVYGFKSREAFTEKSARSYDDERRRIESWLGGCMAFRRSAEGKSVFIAVDNRSVTFNPLYGAWKAKSFTDRDIVLHFCILDLLSDKSAKSIRELTDGVSELLSHTNTPFALDESTVRKKLREYEGMGIVTAEKKGRGLYYRLAEDDTDLSSWESAAAFFSEEAPFGVIGSYILDRLPSVSEHFRFKHHYLLHALDTQVLFDAVCAMKEKRSVELTLFGDARYLVYPLRIYVSTQTGREYLLAYCGEQRKPMFFRLDNIRELRAGEYEERHERYEGFADKLSENLWGVSVGTDCGMDHVEMTVRVDDGEDFIVERLEREKRCGRLERLDGHTYKFTADVYDALELLPWVRSFIGRIISFESDNEFARKRFYDDLNRMAELYAGGEAR